MVQKKGSYNTKLDKLSFLALNLFWGLANRLGPFIPEIHRDLQRSNLSMSPERYFALILLVTFATLPVTIVGIYLSLIGFNFGPIVAAVPLFVFLGGMLVPKMSASTRSSLLQSELVFLVGYMLLLARGGVAPIGAMARIAKSSIFPAGSQEASKVISNIEVLGMDSTSSLDKVGKTCPNPDYSEILIGFASIIKSGGDLAGYLQSKMGDVLEEQTARSRRNADFTGLLSEAYITATVVMGISIFSLYSLDSIISVGSSGPGGLQLIILFSVVVVPFISLVFIALIHSMQEHYPESYNKPYIIFGLGVGIVPLLAFVIPIPLPLFYKLGIGLAASCAVPAIVQYKESRVRKSVEGNISNFLRNMTETLKTGLAPEKCIEALAETDHGGLTVHIQAMSTQISWGVPLDRVIRNFSDNVRGWMAKVTAFLLLEIVDIGGATISTFGSLAEFVEKISASEKEKRALTKPYVFIPYIGAILVIITTLLMISFIQNQITTGPSSIVTAPTDTSGIVTTILAAALFQSWVMGFVAGKMGEGSIAAGFKHAALLAIISMFTIFITTTYYITIPGI
ncbi:MAG: type II secretion system F family protein [Thaumarchaeota archaeon]|nr:type II secretion system F family protein [Nitrososphaerota archaeon]